MRPYPRIILSLLGILILLPGVALFQERQRERAAAEQAPRFAEQPRRLDIRQRDGTHLLLLRDTGPGAVWRMRSPLQGPADAVRIEHLLENLNDPGWKSIVTPRELAVYGLNEPRLTIEVDGERIELGDRNPFTGERYLRRAGGVFLAQDLVAPQLETEHPELILISQEPVPADFPLQSIRTDLFHIMRRQGHWHFEAAAGGETPDTRRPPGAAQAIAMAWLNARAVTVSYWTGPQEGRVSGGESIDQLSTHHGTGPEEAREEPPRATAEHATGAAHGAWADDPGQVLLSAADGRRLRYLRLSERAAPLILRDPQTGLLLHFDARSSAAMYGETARPARRATDA